MTDFLYSMVIELLLFHSVGAIQAAWSSLMANGQTVFAVMTSILLSFAVIDCCKRLLSLGVMRWEYVSAVGCV